MTNDSLVSVDLKVIPTLKGLVSEEVNLIEVLSREEVQTISFVPTSREDIEGDLATDGIGQSQVTKSLFESQDHVTTNSTLLEEEVI
jgi:hypothetical protein